MATLLAFVGLIGQTHLSTAIVAAAGVASSSPNVFDPTSQSKSVKHTLQAKQSYTAGAPSTSALSPMGCKSDSLSMAPAEVALSAASSSHFLSNDGRLGVDVPAGAISASQLAADGGSASLLVRQILPASGSNAGGSGQFSFGAYLIQVVTASGQLAVAWLTAGGHVDVALRQQWKQRAGRGEGLCCF
jgi:hypothetical protein